MHRGNAHRTDQPTNQRINQPTSGGRHAESADCRSRLREFPPLSRHRRLLTAATLYLSRTSSAFASLPTSSPALLSASPSPFTDDNGVCVYRRQSPSTEGFSRFFSPRVYPTPETSRDGGGGGGGRPEGAAVGIGTQARQFSYRTT